MKKIITIFGILICFTAAVSMFTGCADADGLHNQESSDVTFVFTGFSDAASDGDYAVPGSYNNWDNSSAVISLKDGEGTASSTVTVSSSYIKFTLVKTGSWTRSWYPAVKGNALDGTVYQNFDISGVPMGTSVTVTVDGSSGTAVVTAEEE